mmetsp:Transcript_11309/g.12437  ORF Transcript_11309/g.12437 Transcript_11309/m.12437 type:complete len:128 (+) Transcript_11309:301-684(+)
MLPQSERQKVRGRKQGKMGRNVTRRQTSTNLYQFHFVYISHGPYTNRSRVFVVSFFHPAVNICTTRSTKILLKLTENASRKKWRNGVSNKKTKKHWEKQRKEDKVDKHHILWSTTPHDTAIYYLRNW